MKLVYQYMAIFFNFQTTSNHLHPLQVENCDSNSRLVVGEDDYGKFRIERVNQKLCLAITTHNFKWVKITDIYLIWNISSVNPDAWTQFCSQY